MGEPLTIRARDCPAEIIRHSLHIPANVRLVSILGARNLRRGQHVYRQNDPATDVYFLLDGALKAYRVSLDGQEGVVRFYYPHELVWTDGAGSGQRTMSLVAIDECRIAFMPITALQRLMSDHPAVQLRCYELLSRLIAEEQSFISLLACANADRRLAFLLMQLCRHRYAAYLSGFGFSVPMSRADIANYLGLRVETVSRSFTRLENRGIVQVCGRKVILADLPTLELIAAGHDTPVAMTAVKDAGAQR